MAYAQDDNTLYLWNGTAWIPLGGGTGTTLVAIKTAGESVANNTIQNDDHLFLSLQASTTYAFQLVVQYGTTSTADFKFDFDFSGTNSAYREWAMYTTTSLGSAMATATPHTTLGADTAILHGSTGENALMVNGSIAVVNAGTLRFRWAQNTTDATATTIRLGGVLRAWRIA